MKNHDDNTVGASDAIKDGAVRTLPRVQHSPAFPTKRVQNSPPIQAKGVVNSLPIKVKGVVNSPPIQVKGVVNSPPSKVKGVMNSPPIQVKGVVNSPPIKVKGFVNSPPIKVKGVQNSPPTETKGVQNSPPIKVKGVVNSPPIQVKGVVNSPPIKVKGNVPNSPPIQAKRVQNSPPIQVKRVQNSPTLRATHAVTNDGNTHGKVVAADVTSKAEVTDTPKSPKTLGRNITSGANAGNASSPKPVHKETAGAPSTVASPKPERKEETGEVATTDSPKPDLTDVNGNAPVEPSPSEGPVAETTTFAAAPSPKDSPQTVHSNTSPRAIARRKPGQQSLQNSAAASPQATHSAGMTPTSRRVDAPHVKLAVIGEAHTKRLVKPAQNQHSLQSSPLPENVEELQELVKRLQNLQEINADIDAHSASSTEAAQMRVRVANQLEQEHAIYESKLAENNEKWTLKVRELEAHRMSESLAEAERAIKMEQLKTQLNTVMEERDMLEKQLADTRASLERDATTFTKLQLEVTEIRVRHQRAIDALELQLQMAQQEKTILTEEIGNLKKSIEHERRSRERGIPATEPMQQASVFGARGHPGKSDVANAVNLGSKIPGKVDAGKSSAPSKPNMSMKNRQQLSTNQQDAAGSEESSIQATSPPFYVTVKPVPTDVSNLPTTAPGSPTAVHKSGLKPRMSLSQRRPTELSPSTNPATTTPTTNVTPATNMAPNAQAKSISPRAGRVSVQAGPVAVVGAPKVAPAAAPHKSTLTSGAPANSAPQASAVSTIKPTAAAGPSHAAAASHGSPSANRTAPKAGPVQALSSLKPAVVTKPLSPRGGRAVTKTSEAQAAAPAVAATIVQPSQAATKRVSMVPSKAQAVEASVPNPGLKLPTINKPQGAVPQTAAAPGMQPPLSPFQMMINRKNIKPPASHAPEGR